jgi:xanthine dehydrogenase accessory factor
MSIYKDIAELEARGEAAIFCMIVDTKGSTPRHEGSKMLVFPDGHIKGTVGGGEIENRVIAEALDALKDRKTKNLHYNLVSVEKGDPGICGGQVEVYVEPIIPKLTILVVGAGHVGRQVVHLAKWLDYRVVVSDDRAELCTPESMPEADEYVICPMADIPQRMPITPYTYIVVATRGSDVDIAGLPSILETDYAYLGVIGSQKRWLNTQKEINKKKDYSKKFVEVYSPIGIEIKGETPEEIALSIMAEILVVANKTSGVSMSRSRTK